MHDTPAGGMRATWDQAENVTITRRWGAEHDRDTWTVDKAPAVVVILKHILHEASMAPRSPIEWRADGSVRWCFDNCLATYRVVDYDRSREAYLCERLAAMGGGL